MLFGTKDGWWFKSNKKDAPSWMRYNSPPRILSELFFTMSAKSKFLLSMKLSTTLKIFYIVELKMCIYSPSERQFYSQRRRGSSNSQVHHPPHLEAGLWWSWFSFSSALVHITTLKSFHRDHSLGNKCQKHDTKTKNLTISDPKNKNKDLNFLK